MRRVTYVCASVAAALLLNPSLAMAQAQDAQALRQEIDQLRRDFETRLAALEARLADDFGRPAGDTGRAAGRRRAGRRPPSAAVPPPTAQVPAGAEGAGGPSGALPVYGAAVAGSKIFNPDMAVIGDFLGAAGQQRGGARAGARDARSPRRRSRRSSIRTRAPTSSSRSARRASSSKKASSRSPTLPGGLLTKVGKMRAAFGKVNTLHNHVLPWTDRPLVTDNLVGGEDGINDAGVSVARLIPNPLDLPRGDRPGLPRRLGRRRCFTIERARRPELRRPPARLSRHHGIDQHRSRLVVLARSQPVGDRRRRRHRPVHDEAVRRRRDAPLEAAAALDLPLVRRPHRGHLEPARAAGRAAERHGVLRVGRLPVRAALVRRRPLRPLGSRRRRVAARQRAVGRC